MAVLQNQAITLPHNTSLTLSQPTGLCIQLSVFDTAETSQSARSAAKSYLRNCYSKVFGPHTRSSQANYNPCSLHVTTIKLWRARYLEAVEERDLLKRQLAYVRNESGSQRTRIKEKLEGLARHYSKLAEDIEEFRIRESRSVRELEVLAKERDRLLRQVDLLEEDNFELKSRMLEYEAEYESQLVIYKSRVVMLESEIEESKLRSASKTSKKINKTPQSLEILSHESRKPTQEEIMPFLATASSRWSSLLRASEPKPLAINYTIQDKPQPDFEEISEKKFKAKMRAHVVDSIKNKTQLSRRC